MPSSTLLTHLHTAFKHDVLDDQLSAGIDPRQTPELSLRATQLSTRRHRRELARTLRGIVAEATEPRPPARAIAILIARPQVRDAADSLLALAARLDSPRPAHASGIAAVQRMITDTNASPFYVDCAPGAIERRAGVAVAAMDSPIPAAAVTIAPQPAGHVAVPA
jgi:hypothetical protein